MTHALSSRLLGVFMLLMAAVYGTAAVVGSRLHLLQDAGAVALGLTLDLVLVVPVAYYLLVARPAGRAPLGVVPLFLLGIAVGSLVLPAEHRGLLELLIRFAIPAVELCVLGFVAVTVRRTAQHYRRDQSHESDASEFPERLFESLRRTVDPRIAKVLTSEVAVLYYALFCWRQRPVRGPHAFSHHVKSQHGIMTAGFLMAIAAETVPVHLLLGLWSPTAAWVVTALSLYGFVWLIGDYHAVRLRPHELSDGVLHLRLGLRWRVKVPVRHIRRFSQLKSSSPRPRTGYLHAVTFGQPRYLIELETAVTAHGLYGLDKEVTAIGFTVDDPSTFEEKLSRIFTPNPSR